MLLKKGYYLELTDEYQGRILFSVASDSVDSETFQSLWAQVGNFLVKQAGGSEKSAAQYRIRLVPMIGG